MTYAKIILERDGPLAIVRLNDPDRLNALDEVMRRELVEAMTAVLDAPDVRAILLTGEGRGFCAGANLAEFFEIQAAGETPDVGRRLRSGTADMLVQMTETSKPIVAAVNGVAAGFGCGLALAADIVLVGRSGYFFQSFIRLGAVPDGGSTWFIPRLIGRSRATAMMMLGEKIGAEQAVSIGLAHRLFEDAELAGEARALAMRLAQGPTSAYGKLKQLLAKSGENTLAEQLELETVYQEAAFETADCREGIAAFIEKRAPQFKGV